MCDGEEIFHVATKFTINYCRHVQIINQVHQYLCCHQGENCILLFCQFLENIVSLTQEMCFASSRRVRIYMHCFFWQNSIFLC